MENHDKIEFMEDRIKSDIEENGISRMIFPDELTALALEMMGEYHSKGYEANVRPMDGKVIFTIRRKL